jgi:hypothetical protein
MGAQDTEADMRHEQVVEELAKPIAQELLHSGIPARLAYVGVDGDPRVIPIAFVWDGARIVVCTVPASAKVRAMQQNPRVAITIDTEGFPPRVLLVRGAASVEFVEGVPDVYVEGARKLVPADQFEGWESGVRGLYDSMARITITPDWARLLDFETTIPRAVEDIIRAKTAEAAR